MAEERVGRIVGKQSGKVLQVASMETGERIRQWDWSGGPHQLWAIVAVGNGYYRIVNKQSDKVIDVKEWGVDNGAEIHQWGWLRGENQQWDLVDNGNGYYRIVGKQSGKVLDVSNWGMENGVPIQLWDWLGGENQQFEIVEVTATSAFGGDKEGTSFFDKATSSFGRDKEGTSFFKK